MKSTGKNIVSSFSITITFACLSIVGLGLIPFLTIQEHPTKLSPGLNLSFEWPNASQGVIEQEVTSKLEAVFNSMKGIESIVSVSSKGYGKIDITFKKTIDIDAARFEIASLIRQHYSKLPEGVSYPKLYVGTSPQKAEPLLTFSVTGNGNAHETKKYADERILPVLSQLRGIKDLRLVGDVPYEVSIELKMRYISAYKINAGEIAIAINNYFRKELIGQGTYQNQWQNHSTARLLYLNFNNSDTLLWEKVPIKKIKNRIIYLRDVAAIRYKEQLPTSYYRLNGLNTINITVYPENNINTVKLTNEIRDKVKKIYLKPGYSIRLVEDSTAFLSTEINKILFKTIFSFLILALFLLMATKQFSYILLITVNVGVTLSVACILFYLLEVELQMYSLAGLTASLSLIVGNSIMIMNVIKYSRGVKVLVIIFGSVFSLASGLSVFLILKDQQEINLIDFALVIIITVFVSFIVVTLLTPALMRRVKLKIKGDIQYNQKKRIIKLSGIYDKAIVLSSKIKWVLVIVLVFSFGIPIHWLPEKVNGTNPFSTIYNETFGNKLFRETIKPTLEKILGGSLRLFTNDSFQNYNYSKQKKTILHVRGSMPLGCSVQQLNDAIIQMEKFIKQFSEVESFQSIVSSYRNGEIAIQFRPEYELSDFPYFLKSRLESKAISIGGVDWGIFGVGIGFSIFSDFDFKNCRIVLEGYNYDRLYKYAEKLQEELLKNTHVKNVDIGGGVDRWEATETDEIFTEFNEERLTLHGISQIDLYNALKLRDYKLQLSPVDIKNEKLSVLLTSDALFFNRWNYYNDPLMIRNRLFKLDRLGSLEKRKKSNDIFRYNQQYRLLVSYNFVGHEVLAEKTKEEYISRLREVLPMGFSIRSDQFQGRNISNMNQYYLLMVGIVIIYFICSILLNSLIQPIAIIVAILISFVGVFFTFYFFKFNFDQGGVASLSLLCGSVTCFCLYIITQYNSLYKVHQKRAKSYSRTLVYTFVPLSLIITSYIVGMIPFVVDGQKAVFWFPFGAGVIGGLLFSVFSVLIYLPLFLVNSSKKSLEEHSTCYA